MPRRTGSPIPWFRWRRFILRDSCVACQFFRRLSSGWEDCRGAEEEDAVVVVVVVREGWRLERSVSWIPGAEGADLDDGVLFVWVEWEDGGAMRRVFDDWRGISIRRCVRPVEVAYHSGFVTSGSVFPKNSNVDVA